MRRAEIMRDPAMALRHAQREHDARLGSKSSANIPRANDALRPPSPPRLWFCPSRIRFAIRRCLAALVRALGRRAACMDGRRHRLDDARRDGEHDPATNRPIVRSVADRSLRLYVCGLRVGDTHRCRVFRFAETLARCRSDLLDLCLCAFRVRFQDTAISPGMIGRTGSAALHLRVAAVRLHRPSCEIFLYILTYI